MSWTKIVKGDAATLPKAHRPVLAAIKCIISGERFYYEAIRCGKNWFDLKQGGLRTAAAAIEAWNARTEGAKNE